MTSVCIAGDTSDMDGMTRTLAKREEDEAILASSQLPCKLILTFDMSLTK